MVRLSRSRWEAFGDSFYAGDLPESLADTYRRVHDGNRRAGWIGVEFEPPGVEKIVRYLRSTGRDAEVVGVFSPYLESLGHGAWPAPNYRFLGFDALQVGEWSMLGELSTVDRKFVDLPVNENFLLDDASHVTLVEQCYRRLEARELVEEIGQASDFAPLEATRIYSPV